MQKLLNTRPTLRFCLITVAVCLALGLWINGLGPLLLVWLFVAAAFIALRWLQAYNPEQYAMVMGNSRERHDLAMIREYQHALEHVVDCTNCVACKTLAQGALDGVNREDFLR